MNSESDANEDRIPNSLNIFQTASPARWESRDVQGGRQRGGVCVAISRVAQTPRRSPFINYLISD